MGEVGWSDLPVDLVDLLADRSSSNIDLLRIRSICKPWRSTVAAQKRVRNHFQPNFPIFWWKKTVASPFTFFRVTLPSLCPNKGWLIKTKQVSEFSKYRLLSPLSNQPIAPSYKTLDLLNFGVSEIRQSYEFQYLPKNVNYDTYMYSNRVVFLDNLFFVVDYENKIWCCKDEEESGCWKSINNIRVEGFVDIILHRGKVYALDLIGGIWWICLSELNIYQYRPSNPKDDDDINNCIEKRLVEYCGDLCILHRFGEKYRRNRVNSQRTVGFKVYKMDEDLVKWVEVSSLGDKALIVATDSCFTVLASEYYGCLENAIYFSDAVDYSVFKFDDGSIITTKKIHSSYSSSHQSCFHMFSTPFLW